MIHFGTGSLKNHTYREETNNKNSAISKLLLTLGRYRVMIRFRRNSNKVQIKTRSNKFCPNEKNFYSVSIGHCT